MRPLPTSADHRSYVGEAHTPTGGDASSLGFAAIPSIPVVRRAYFELVALRQSEGPSPLSVLADPRFGSALGALRDAAQGDALRIAALVVLPAPSDARRNMLADVMRAADALARHDIALDVWPQLDDADRFLCGGTARAFQERLLPLVDRLEKSGRSDVGLALDLEPPAAWSTSVWNLARGGLPGRAQHAAQLVWRTTRQAFSARQGRRDLTELARDLAARSMPVHVAVLPPMSADGELVRASLLSVPTVDDTGAVLFENQAAMCYATSLARLSPRYDRARQKHALALWAARHKQHSDSVIVGQTATGIFGDEPTYESASHLAEDVRAMEALGFTDIAVYALEGVLFGPTGLPNAQLALRDDVEQWLGAMMGR